MAKRNSKIVGFIITPGEIENRIAALDKSIQALARAVAGNNTKALNSKWREGFDAFVRRWTVERDSYATYESRLFATRVMPRLDAFEANYRAWAKEFQQRTGNAPPVPVARPSEGLADAIVPGGMLGGWVLGAIALGVFLYMKQK